MIDSFIAPWQTGHPIKAKLQSLGVTELGFAAITHPHADHYEGMWEIFSTFRVKKFLTFPIDAFVTDKKRLSKLSHLYKKIYEETDSEKTKKSIEEFLKVLVFAKENIGPQNWEEPVGFESRVLPEGFTEGIDLFALLPMRSQKGAFFSALDSGKVEIVESSDLNNLSLAFLLKYKGHEILLGGDGTISNWIEHKRKRQPQPLAADIVKLPHHGSKKDCTDENLDYMFRSTGERIAIISADGKSHPSSETLKLLDEKNIKPYCTNLASQCGEKVHELRAFPEFLPVLNRFITMSAEPTGHAVQPCQGEIIIEINDDGLLSVDTEHKAFCPYRNADLFAA